MGGLLHFKGKAWWGGGKRGECLCFGLIARYHLTTPPPSSCFSLQSFPPPPNLLSDTQIVTHLCTDHSAGTPHFVFPFWCPLCSDVTETRQESPCQLHSLPYPVFPSDPREKPRGPELSSLMAALAPTSQAWWDDFCH